MRVWDVATGTERARLPGRFGSVPVLALALADDGKVLASATRDGAVVPWDVETFREVRALEGPSTHVHDLAFSPDGRSLLTTSKDETLKFWSLKAAAKPAATP